MTAAGRVRAAGVWLDGHAYVALPVMLAVVAACAVLFAVTWASRHPELTVVRAPAVTAVPAGGARPRQPASRVTVTRPARTVTAYPAAVPPAPTPAPASTARHSMPPPVTPPPSQAAAPPATTPPASTPPAPTLTPEPAPTPAPTLTPSPTLSESDPGTAPGTPFASVTASATPLDTGPAPVTASGTAPVTGTGTAPGQPATADTTSSGGPP